MMRRSLLYNLHGHQIKPDVEVSADRFVEVYRSKYGKVSVIGFDGGSVLLLTSNCSMQVRIYKISGVSEESKKWIAENYECDAEGSWFCPGKYPPGLKPFLDTKKDFRQLEDFNRQDRDDEYQKKYFENLQNPEAARRAALERDRQAQQQQPPPKAKVAATPPLPQVEIDEEELARRKDRMYNTWEDNDATTRMWQIISDGRINDLQKWLAVAPEVAFLRSRDGRGPMFWAYEQRNEDITKILLKAGVPNTDRDAQGKTPVDLLD
jgi:dolichyl-diphosphooligosaccharide---protein glycosyltransferase